MISINSASKQKVLEYIHFSTGICTEADVVSEIMKSPYKRLLKEQYELLFTADYYPGTFSIFDRAKNPSFLFDEKKQTFQEWAFNAVNGEIRQLSKVSRFKEDLSKYGEEKLMDDFLNILFFKDSDNRLFAETIANQEYSDVFRRIILFLLYNNPNYEINTYTDFNNIGKRLIPHVLNKGDYSLKQRLCQSIYSGLIGMDIKDELAATSPLSEEKIIRLKTSELDTEKIDRIYKRLDAVASSSVIDIDSWKSFEKKVVLSDKLVKLCWFTDDFIPTMFEMKFMEELLEYNKNVIITIIPRVQSYSNDASFSDVESMIELPIYTKLKKQYHDGRFKISHYGLDMGTFNGKRLSKECADIMLDCDHVIIAGARSYEMGQGIKKNCFFTGIAICRTYSETVTGICKDDGAIVFLEQLNGEKSFAGFKARSSKRKYCQKHDRWFPVAEFTSLDYLTKRNDNE